MAGKSGGRSLRRAWIFDQGCRRESSQVCWEQAWDGDPLAGKPPSLVSSRLRNLLRGTLSEGNAAGPQSELLGFVGRLQVLEKAAREKHLLYMYICLLSACSFKWSSYAEDSEKNEYPL